MSFGLYFSCFLVYDKDKNINIKIKFFFISVKFLVRNYFFRVRLWVRFFVFFNSCINVIFCVFRFVFVGKDVI